MDKILVEVYVPTVNISYDVYIPVESKIEEVKLLIASAISELTDNRYKKGSKIVLCNFATGKEYKDYSRIFETDIENGTKIMII